MTRCTIRRIDLRSAFQFGFVAGCIALLAPGLVAGILTRWLVALLRAWVAPLQGTLTIPLVWEGAIVDLLNLNGLVSWLNRLDALGWLLMVMITATIVVVGGLLNAFSTLATAWSYNFIAAFSGGVAVDADLLAWTPVSTPGGAPQPTPAAPTRRARLVLQANPAQSWVLQPVVTTLGSTPKNHIVLPGLAAHHAEIRRENQGYVLYNLGNSQTWVDGRPMPAANLLKPGFVLRLGPYELIYQSV